MNLQADAGTSNERSAVQSERIVILAPSGRDGELAMRILGNAGFHCEAAADVTEVCDAIRQGAGAVVLAEEALSKDAVEELAEALACEEAWSEIPILILATQSSLAYTGGVTERLGDRSNVTLLDRPIHLGVLVSALRSAIRARRRQYEVKDLLEKLELRIQERDRFLAMLGHELRNPLATILLATEAAASDGETWRYHIEVIERQSRRLARLVDDLLDVSRITAGKIALQRVPADLRELLRACIDPMRSTFESHGIELETEMPAERVVSEVDVVRMEQVVINLLTNAIRHTPTGGRVVASVSTDRASAYIRVRDNGDGISPAMRHRIFELFVQGSGKYDGAKGGMGVGLTLVRNLVELHGGNVWAESDGVRRGSEFVVRLPLSDAEPVATPAYKPEARGTAGRRIALIEDNPDLRELLRVRLTRAGHEVFTAADGIEGIATVIAKRPDVALVDIGLPGADGHEVARRVRAELGSEVFLVALTGFGRPEDREKALTAGFDEHMPKPVDVQKLAEILSGSA
jgi:signal transduction histidine kinase/CheY-like chemotaxis protein